MEEEAQKPPSAPCPRCGESDTAHVCIICHVCRDFTRHEENPRRPGRFLCVPCEERARLLGARWGGAGRAGYICKRLDLGVFRQPERAPLPRLEDIYN